MIIPFVMSLTTISKHPYLWFFYKSLDMAKRKHWPVIAQEKYFEKPSQMAKKGADYAKFIENKDFVDRLFIYELPKDGDLDRISRYPIPQAMEDKLVKDTGSYNNAMAFALTKGWQELEELLDGYFTDIENNSNEKIDAVITLCWYPSLYNAAKKHNIPVINMEQGVFREPAYLKTAYFSFTNLNDDDKEIEQRYSAFKKVSQKLPELSRKEILALMLEDDYLGYLNYYDMIPRYELGVATGYTTWMPFLTRTYFNNEELLYRASLAFDKFIVRMHPADPAKAAYPKYIKTPDNSANTIEFILKCKRIASLGSNVSLEAAYWNKTPYMELPYSSYSVRKPDFTNKEEYSMDIGYLNFFAFCFIIPYTFVMDPEYIKWRLSGPSEEEIFRKHFEYYLKRRSCDPHAFLSAAHSDRLAYILKCRGHNDMASLSVPTNISFTAGRPVPVSADTIKTLTAENKALKSEINLHIANERKYEAAIVRLKKTVSNNRKNAKAAAYYKKAYEAVLNSTSWKILAPFRAVKDFFARLFRKK